MKKQMENSRPVLTDGEDRAIWQAIDDERKKKKGRSRRWLAWPATAGATAIALLLVVSYFGGGPEEKGTIDRALTPERHRLFEVIEKGVGSEGESVADEPVAVEAELEEPERTEPVTVAEKGAEKPQTVMPEAAAEKTREMRGGRSELAAGGERALEKNAAESRFNQEREEGGRPDVSRKPERAVPTRTSGDDESRSEMKVDRKPAVGAGKLQKKDSPRIEPIEEGERYSALEWAAEMGSGICTGTVIDGETGEEIPDAVIVIPGLRTQKGGLAGDRGRFLLLGFRPGEYDVVARKDGYGDHRIRNVSFRRGEITSLQFQLAKGGTSRSEKYSPPIDTDFPEASDPTVRAGVPPSSAQSADRGTLSGTVRDAESGKPIAWADVMLRGTGIGGISQKNGTFTVFNVPPGTYTVLVQMQGYAPKTFEGVVIAAGQVMTLHIKMGETAVKIDAIMIGAEEEIDVKHSSTKHHIEKKMGASKPGNETEDSGSKKTLGYLEPTTVHITNPKAGRVETEGKEKFSIRSINKATETLSSQAGVSIDGRGHTHRRGGRSSEVQFIGDGMQIQDPHSKRHWPISVGGTDPVNGAAFDAMFFEHYGVNPFIDPEEDRYATFAVDVDNASYTMTRSYLERGELPPKEAVRVEEFVNAFRHDYESSREDAFAIHLDAAASPFGEGYALLRVGLKGREIESKDRKPAVLTFLIDVSGSMGREDRLELVKWALYDLLGEMDDRDEVGIVVYGSDVRVVLKHTSLRRRERIERAIAALRPGGATNAEAGLVVAYDQADRAFRRGAINRVILCSDGVANVGRTGADDILERIADEADRGIAMTAVGFGMGNYNDVLMEQLADKGDGNYYYVDEMKEARRVFVENLTGTLQTIAKEVKIQVEFEPGTVRRYRLIGYENRDVRDEDFRNDAVDAGEIGAGHEVTALFEVRLEKNPESGTLATVRVRHEDPESGEVTERSRSIGIDRIAGDMSRADPTFRLDAAVAEFAEILRKSYWAREGDLSEVFRLARDAARDLEDRDQADELLDLIDRAMRLAKEENGGWRDDDRYHPSWEDENDE